MPAPIEVFPDDLINEIAASMDLSQSKKALLRLHLRDLAQFVHLFKTTKLGVPPSQLARNAESIVKHIDRLANDFGLDPATMKPSPDSESKPLAGLILWQVAFDLDQTHPERRIREGDAQAELQHRLELLLYLKEAIDRIQTNLQSGVSPGRGGSRAESDWALHETVRQLMVTYWEVTRRRTGTSVKPLTGEVGGPLVRFLELCLPPLGWTLSRNSIRGLVRAIKKADEKETSRSGQTPLP